MTTSGVTTWSLTARDIVKEAMLELNILSPGEEPEAEELQRCLVRLNGLLKSSSTVGGFGFLEATGTVTIPAGAASGVLPAGVRSINTARVVVSSTYHRQMQPFNRTQYLSLPNKIASGSPTIYYISDTGDTTTMYVWPVPTAITTIAVDYTRTIETVTDGTETLDLPQEWQEAAYLALAVRIAPMFGTARIDPQTLALVEQRAERLAGALLDAERPDSYFFEAWDS